MEAEGLTAARESLLLLGSSVLCWSALGWGGFALFSHLSTHLFQQFPVTFATCSLPPTPVALAPGGRACSSSLCSHCTRALASTPTPLEPGLRKHTAGMVHKGRTCALQQSPFTAAGEQALEWPRPSVSQQVLVLARWVRQAPDYTGC